MEKDLAPICLFTYNRLEETKQTIDALQNNQLALVSNLFIFSDGPKQDSDIEKVQAVRNYLNNIAGFHSITIFRSNSNKGLADSIIDGVSQIVAKHHKVIVLEDDLVTSKNFLTFMNQALDFYEQHDKIYSISGFTLDLPSLHNYTKHYYLGYRASSWGWGTWLNRWASVDWQIKTYQDFRWNVSQQLKFMRGGSDMPRMLRNQVNNKIDSWAIRWCYNQFKRNQLTVFPSSSKVKSIGFGDEATHTKKTTRFFTKIDTSNQQHFEFDKSILLNTQLVKEFRQKFSIKNRILDRFS